MSCTCQVCHMDYTVDLNIPDELWDKITSDDENLLCSACIMGRIEHHLDYEAFKLVDIENGYQENR